MLLALTAGNVAVKADNRGDVRERNRLALAERFTAGKLENMLFSTTVDPHWFKSGEKFWYNYKTSEGTRWYIVDPVARKRTEKNGATVIADPDRRLAKRWGLGDCNNMFVLLVVSK